MVDIEILITVVIWTGWLLFMQFSIFVKLEMEQNSLTYDVWPFQQTSCHFVSGLSLYKPQGTCSAYQSPWSLAGLHLHRSRDIGHRNWRSLAMETT